MGFRNDDGEVVNMLDHVSFTVKEGKAIGIVGESGCGKSMTNLSIMRLLPRSAVIQGGEILYKGQDLLKLSQREMEEIRGRDIAMIFQEPMTSLNPVLNIGFQIGEVLQRHNPELSKEDVKKAVIEQLRVVGIPNPEKRYGQYPHQFSGGMRQRVMIAMATICHPTILIADEPTTALDVTIQAQVLDLMSKLKVNGSLMLITHNLGIVAEICDEVVVMYAGRVVESGAMAQIFDHPSHPYTVGLMAAIPTLTYDKSELYSIPGVVPISKNFLPGCRFAPRCRHAMPHCAEQVPPVRKLGANHQVHCWLEFEQAGEQ
jgi:oligopeptide/dipeptide ABC transporter ATP-binding protein